MLAEYSVRGCNTPTQWLPLILYPRSKAQAPYYPITLFVLHPLLPLRLHFISLSAHPQSSSHTVLHWDPWISHICSHLRPVIFSLRCYFSLILVRLFLSFRHSEKCHWVYLPKWNHLDYSTSDTQCKLVTCSFYCVILFQFFLKFNLPHDTSLLIFLYIMGDPC